MYSYFKLMIWGCILWWIWLFTFPFRRGRDNCLTWAQRQQDQKGGYLVIRWCTSSKSGIKWPHFAWLPPQRHEHIVHYVPKNSECDKHWIPSLWFNGGIKNGDDEDVDN